METNSIRIENNQPGVGTSYNISWDNLRKNFVELLLVMVISFAISIPLIVLRAGIEATGLPGGIIFGLMSFVYAVFVTAPISYGVAYVFLKLIRGEKFDIADIFEGFKSNYIHVVLSYLLTGAIVAAGIIFFIVPGIIFACKLAFVPYLIIDKKMDTVEAVKKSWEMTKGYTGTIFLIGLLAIPIAIAGMLLLVIGIIPASIWIEGAFAAIYFTVDQKLSLQKEDSEIVEAE